MVARQVKATSPAAVECSIAPLGWSLSTPLAALYDWTRARLPEVEAAQAAFDRAAGL